MLGGTTGVLGAVPSNARNLQLRQSARTVTACLTRDEQQIPDPWDLLQSSYSRDYLSLGSAGEMRLQVRQVHVIPDILMAQFEGQECRCFMGLFPEIGRAWMTVDNRLFLWDYATGRDYTCFDELNQVIIDVALVRPKGDIFVSSIKHLLVIVNAAEIVLLGVTLNSETGTGGDLVLHKTGLGFPSDEVNMLSVIGTRSGRIFAGGQDGNLYEFIYQAEEGWFTRKCRKVNKTSSPMSYFTPTFLKMSQSSSAIVSLTYDNGRNLLYALGDDSTIQVFYLGTRDNSFDKIFHASDLYDRASSLCPTGVLNKKGFKVVSISAVEAADSAFIHLIAMTSCGVKLYFTTLKRDERAYSRNQLLSSPPTPSTFEMVHVRLPPEDGRLRESRRLLTTCSPNVHTSFTKNGVTLCANAISDQEDLLIGTILNQAVATSPGRHGPLECISDVHVEGKIWEIAKVHCESPPDIVGKRISASFMESISPLPSDAGKYLILTNAGVFSLTKTTPVEELQKILIDSNGNMENPLLKQYFDAYSADQGCFLCIVLACTVQNAWKSFASTSTSRSILDSKTCANLSLWAVNAMIRFGGEPRIIETSIPGIDYIGLPSSSILNVPAFGSRIEYEFSDLHRGLYLYFSRLVVSFWNKPLISFTEPNSEVMMALHSYCEFLERNPGLSSRTFLTSASPNMGNISKETRQKLEESHHAENESIRTLIWLARATLELLAFLSICKDYHILDTSLRDNGDGEKLEFEDLLATPRGRELVSDIASALVQKQLKMRSSIDSLCQILLQRCPNFFGESEIMTFQGTECLERAFLTRDTSERNLQLQESLTMFLKGSSTMSFSTLSDVARRYQSLAFFPGLIELCLYSAQIRDPENIALSAFRTSNIQLTTQQQEIINLREGIYSFVFEALRAVHGLEARTISSVIGPIDVDKLQKETLSRAIKSRDELFHIRLYDWLITEHLASLLMDIETPFVLPFLESKFRDRVELCHDLLWKYLARHGRFLEASKILDELASSPELYAQFLTLSDPFSHLNLPDRIERLSLALGNARSEIRMTLEAAEFVQELEERLDVAKLQNEVLEAVIAQYGDVSEVSELNCVLFDISQLFNRFTRPLKLYECSLMLIHCSSYQDQLLVHQLWTSILEKTVIGNHFDALSQKIAELAKKLYPSPFAFPLNFILDSVMILALKHGQSTDLVGTTFIHSGVPVKDCLEQICELAHSQATFWTKDDNREFLFNVFIIIAGKSLDRHLLKSSDLLMMTNYLSKATIPPPVSGQLSVLRDRCK